MNSPSPRRSLPSRSKLGGIAVVALVAAYSLAAPYVNERFGLDLPAIEADAEGNVQVVGDPVEKDLESTKATSANSRTTSNEAKTEGSKTDQSIAKPSAVAKPSQAHGISTKARGPLADRMRSSSRNESDASNIQANSNSPSPTDDGDRLFGLLREVSPKRYLSPAGLLYAPGSAEGHRLEHLRRHVKDDPRRPGPHGVFDGDMEGALKTIDRAFERAKKGQRTTKKQDRGRTIYTVDMGGRVGFVGGRDGNRKRKPMARRVRIVVEGNRLITAYPL